MSDDFGPPMPGWTASEMSASVRSGAVRAADLVAASLRRAAAVQGSLNPFTEIYHQDAAEQAAGIDRLSPEARAALPLCGVPVAIKDFTPMAGKRTTLGSLVFRDHVATRDAVVVERLKQAGAVVVARTTTPEFAHAGFTFSRLWGVTRNPWDSSRTPGGSSGGSAVAVATGCVPIAEGTDMGGSVRIPAALCGTVGLMPSQGRIPMDILPTQADALSRFGCLTRTVEDAALFLAATEGPDDRDHSSLPPMAPVALPGGTSRKPRLAASLDLGIYDVAPDVAALFERSVESLRAAGAVVDMVEPAMTQREIDDWGDLWAVFFAGDVGHLLPDHAAEIEPAVVALIEQGRRLSAVEMRHLEHRRTAMWTRMAGIMAGYDGLICPTTAMTAPDVSLNDAAVTTVLPDGRYRTLDMCVLFNLIGRCPVIALPMGLTPGGLPAGLQVLGHRHDDEGILAIARFMETCQPWDSLWPNLGATGG